MVILSMAISAFDYQLGLNLVNQVRQGLGAPPLRLSPILNAVAEKYAQTMAKYHMMGHSVDSSHFDQRIKLGGYNGNNLAENVAEGYNSIADVMKGWVASAGHFQNLVNPAYTEVGFGMATDSEGSVYWCQDFGNGHTTASNSQYPPSQENKDTAPAFISYHRTTKTTTKAKPHFLKENQEENHASYHLPYSHNENKHTNTSDPDFDRLFSAASRNNVIVFIYLLIATFY
eukprot:NODE_172_length_14331_cov_0.709177.p11 type:complete len:230 gc:universal NODE_172_length_14331_cov_0.709177:9594-8905(-)